MWGENQPAREIIVPARQDRQNEHEEDDPKSDVSRGHPLECIAQSPAKRLGERGDRKLEHGLQRRLDSVPGNLSPAQYVANLLEWDAQ